MAERNSGAADINDLTVRAAWLYFVEGLTQEQVAQKLGISRIRALRLLAASREDGTVQIQINARSRRQVELERSLETRFGLARAIVVPASHDDENIPALIGHAAGSYLSEQIESGMTIGVGWGSTLQASLNSMAHRKVDGVTIVSLLGGLTHWTGLNPSLVAWRLAEFYGAECYQITSPVFATDEAMRTSLWAHPELREVQARAARLDVAIVSVGDVSAGATIFRQGLLDEGDIHSLRLAGAIGDVLCHFIDRDGAVIDHPINRRVMATHPAALQNAKKVILASGGARKVEIIRAALRATLASVLITDESAAEGILHQTGELPAKQDEPQ